MAAGVQQKVFRWSGAGDVASQWTEKLWTFRPAGTEVASPFPPPSLVFGSAVGPRSVACWGFLRRTSMLFTVRSS